MKVMLVCTSGMSTSLVMKKIDNYAKAHHLDITLVAYPLQEYHEHESDYDIILLGPHISYRLEEIQQRTTNPVLVMDSLDYALGRAENIVKTIEKYRT